MTRYLRAGVLTALVALVSGIGTATAGTPHHSPLASRTGKDGLYVTGHGRIYDRHLRRRESNLIIDRRNGVHVIAGVAGRHHQSATYRYLTGKGRHGPLAAHPVKFNLDSSRLAEQSSVDGRHIDAIFATCNGIFTSTSSIHSHRLPRPKKAVPGEDGCVEKLGDAYSLDGVEPRPHNRLLLLVAATNGTPWGYQVWVGKPGSRFALSPHQPTEINSEIENGNLRFQTLVQDPTTRALEMTFETESSDATTISVATQVPGHDWTDPTTVRTLAKNQVHLDWKTEAATAYADTLAIAVRPQVPDPHHSSTTRLGAYYLLRSHEAGPAGMAKLPHTNSSAADLRLLTNLTNGHLHAAWDTSKGALPYQIFTEDQVGTTWTKYVSLKTPHTRYVFLDSLALTPHGQPVASYNGDS